jgi:hypothetical protein
MALTHRGAGSNPARSTDSIPRSSIGRTTSSGLVKVGSNPALGTARDTCIPSSLKIRHGVTTRVSVWRSPMIVRRRRCAPKRRLLLFQVGRAVSHTAVNRACESTSLVRIQDLEPGAGARSRRGVPAERTSAAPSFAREADMVRRRFRTAEKPVRFRPRALSLADGAKEVVCQNMPRSTSGRSRGFHPRQTGSTPVRGADGHQADLVMARA